MREGFSECMQCGGEAFHDGRCLAHLEDEALELVLEGIARGEVVRARGVELSGERWTLIREHLPRGEGERLSLRNALLRGARFGDGCSFAELELEGARLGKATFGTDANFSGACFGDGAEFESASFGDSVSFSRASFGDHACFEGSSFGHDVDFSRATFGDGARFNGSAVDETEVAFGDRARFSYASFGEGTNFTRARFGHQADLSGCKFGQHASFWYAKFGDRAQISGCRFGDASNFDNATLGDHAYFAGSTWGDDAGLANTTFGHSASFLGASFGDRAGLGRVVLGDGAGLRASFGASAGLVGATFGDHADLCGAVFGSAPDFTKATFGDHAMLLNATFGDRADFSGTTFGEGSTFARARFGEQTDFSEAEFAGSARFARVRFAGEVEFAMAHFGGDVTFLEARFTDEVDLVGVRFDGDADFSHARFAGFGNLGPFASGGRASFGDAEFDYAARIRVAAPMLDLTGASFRGPLNVQARFATLVLDGVAFEGQVAVAGVDPFSSPVYGEFDEAVAREAAKRLGDLSERPRLLRLRGVDAGRLELTRVDLESCLFAGARNLGELRVDQTSFRERPARRFRRRQGSAIADEHLWRWRNEDKAWRPPVLPAGEEEKLEARSHPHEIAEAYRGLRKSREAAGDPTGTNDFYFGEMEMRREATSPLGRLALLVYRELAGYDVRPSRPLLALGSIVLGGALLLQLLGEAGGANFGESVLFCVRSALLQPGGGIADPGVVAEVVETGLRVAGPILLAFTGITGLRARLRR